MPIFNEFGFEKDIQNSEDLWKLSPLGAKKRRQLGDQMDQIVDQGGATHELLMERNRLSWLDRI